MNADTSTADLHLDTELLTLAVEVLRVLADPTRLQIAWLLRHEELSVSELAGHLGRPIAGVSQHLAKMRMARLVATRRDGTTIYYRVDDDHVKQLVGEIAHHTEHLVFASPAHHATTSAPASSTTSPTTSSKSDRSPLAAR